MWPKLWKQASISSALRAEKAEDIPERKAPVRQRLSNLVSLHPS